MNLRAIYFPSVMFLNIVTLLVSYIYYDRYQNEEPEILLWPILAVSLAQICLAAYFILTQNHMFDKYFMTGKGKKKNVNETNALILFGAPLLLNVGMFVYFILRPLL